MSNKPNGVLQYGRKDLEVCSDESRSNFGAVLDCITHVAGVAVRVRVRVVDLHGGR